MHFIGYLLTNLFGGLVGTMLVGGGLALTTYAVSKPLIMSGLTEAAQKFDGMPGDILQVALIAGLGEVLSIIGSGIATRLGVQAGRVALRRVQR